MSSPATEPSSIEDLVESFELFEDWQDRYGYLIELGRELPPFPEAARTPENKVKGCMSQVWLVADPMGQGSRVLCFHADSDAHIARGLVAVILTIFSGHTPQEILDTDPRPVFARLGLDKHLSMGRSNGLLSMVGKIKEIAAAAA